jgi:outer membrane protein assembly factor BamB
MTKRLIQFLAMSAVLTALFACSSESVNVPSELSDIDDPIELEELWDVDSGTGDNELQLQLEPFVSGPVVFTVDIEGNIQARSVETGKLQWEADLDQRVSGGVAGDSRRIYVTSFQGEMIALSREDGSELWRSRLSSEALSVAASDGAAVVVHSSDGRIFAFNTESGKQRWRYDSDTPALSLRGTSAPMIFENSVLIGLANGELVSLDLFDGRMRWEVSLGQPSGRTELERLVDADGNYVELYGSVFAAAFQGDVKAINIATGSEIWSKPISTYRGVAVSRAAELLVVTDSDGLVYGLDVESGKEVWRTEALKYRRLSGAEILGNYAVVADFEGYVHLLEVVSGAIVGRVQPDSDGIMGRMKVVGSTLYVYTRSGDLFAYRITP